MVRFSASRLIVLSTRKRPIAAFKVIWETMSLTMIFQTIRWCDVIRKIQLLEDIVDVIKVAETEFEPGFDTSHESKEPRQ